MNGDDEYSRQDLDFYLISNDFTDADFDRNVYSDAEDICNRPKKDPW